MGQTVNYFMQTRIEKEAILHKDILQFDFLDGYYNLAPKYAAFFNWINNYCVGVDFVLKIDDDVYVNVRNLASTLAYISPSVNQSYGLVSENPYPIRSNSFDCFLQWI